MKRSLYQVSPSRPIGPHLHLVLFHPQKGPFCVPRVYLASVFLRFFILLAFRRINNLRFVNATNSSIPTAPY